MSQRKRPFLCENAQFVFKVLQQSNEPPFPKQKIIRIERAFDLFVQNLERRCQTAVELMVGLHTFAKLIARYDARSVRKPLILYFVELRLQIAILMPRVLQLCFERGDLLRLQLEVTAQHLLLLLCFVLTRVALRLSQFIPRGLSLCVALTDLTRFSSVLVSMSFAYSADKRPSMGVSLPYECVGCVCRVRMSPSHCSQCFPKKVDFEQHQKL